MKIINTYQQSFSSYVDSTYSWRWDLNRVFKTNPKNKLVVKITSSIYTTSLDNVLLYMYNPDMCGRVNTTIKSNTNRNSNKILLHFFSSTFADGYNDNQTIICDNIPTSSIDFSLETMTLGAVPILGNFYPHVNFIIYEVEGDIDCFP